MLKFLIPSLVFLASAASAHDNGFGLVPRPWKMKVLGAGFEVRPETLLSLSPDNAETRALALALNDGLRFPSQLKIGDGRLRVSLEPGLKDLGEEGYRLRISPEGVDLRAFAAAGAFYGIQTLRQLLPERLLDPSAKKDELALLKRALPGLEIEDKPRFAWRGHMLDVGRHFMPEAGILRTLDLLALHKMNRFHWHLTEDQGWRLQIKKYPKLTSVGAWRVEQDGKTYGGFYTQKEIREVVAYAAARHIVVVPELEMPGHSSAALASYPELACKSGPFTVPNTWGVFDDVLCPGKDSTFTFIEAVLDEVLPLFPSPYVHIGGDECPKARWQAHDLCQQRMKQEGLKDEKALQSWFLGKISAMLKARGKRLIGWDEICEGGAPEGSIVQWWTNPGPVAEAAKQGHFIIATNYDDTYLDQSHSAVSLRRLYRFSPYPPGLPTEAQAQVLGAEAPLWTEGVPTQADADRQSWPRLCALAENLWLSPELKDVQDFEARLETHKGRLRALGVNYHDFGAELGQWNPAFLRKYPKGQSWKLQGLVPSPGRYVLTFEYLEGPSSLEIRDMTVKSGGETLVRLTSTAHAGYWMDEPTLEFEVNAAQIAAGLSLECSAKPEKGGDSFGRICLKVK